MDPDTKDQNLAQLQVVSLARLPQKTKQNNKRIGDIVH